MGLINLKLPYLDTFAAGLDNGDGNSVEILDLGGLFKEGVAVAAYDEVYVAGIGRHYLVGRVVLAATVKAKVREEYHNVAALVLLEKKRPPVDFIYCVQALDISRR